MINPSQIINYNRTDAELEELVLFLVAVAGKNAKTTSELLNKFFFTSFEYASPFQQIRELDLLGSYVVNERIISTGFGCHTRLTKSFLSLAYRKFNTDLSDFNLRTCKLENLLEIHGIGMKSASCFLAWTRKDVQVAMLDTHLLKYLKTVQATGSFEIVPTMETDAETKKQLLGSYLEIKIPKSTPSSRKLYLSLQNFYLDICRFTQVDPTDWDLEIWKHYSKS